MLTSHLFHKAWVYGWENTFASRDEYLDTLSDHDKLWSKRAFDILDRRFRVLVASKIKSIEQHGTEYSDAVTAVREQVRLEIEPKGEDVPVFDRRGAEIVVGGYVIWLDNRGCSSSGLYRVKNLKSRVQIEQDGKFSTWIDPYNVIVVDSIPEVEGTFNIE